jgi:predicted site-specific integrase-resolvase
MTPRISDRAIWIRVALAAHILGKSRWQVRRYIEAGLVRARRVGREGWWEVARQDVEKLAGSRAA